MNALFSAVALKIYLILGGVGALLAMLFAPPGQIMDQEAIYNAGQITSFYWNVSLGIAAAVHFGVFLCVAAPVTVGRTYRKVADLLPSLPSGEQQQQLNAGISIAPDLLIRFDSPHETQGEFGKKGLAALHTKERAYWILILAWGERKGVVIREDNTEIEFDRFTRPWQKPEEWATPRNYENETWDEYDADMREVKKGWQNWIIGAKIEHKKDKGGWAATYCEKFALATIFFLFLFSVSAFAQKSAQVRDYVGADKFNKIKVSGPVVFYFHKLPIPREGKGRTLAEILPDGRTYTDESNAGSLDSITALINGKIRRIKQAAPPVVKLSEPTYDTENPAKMVRPSTRYTATASLSADSSSTTWDSLRIANSLNSTTEQLKQSKGKLWGLTLTAWNTVIRWVETFFYGLIWFAGITRFIAVACNNEKRITAWGTTIYGEWISGLGGLATALTFFTALGLVLVFLTTVFIRAITGHLLGILELFFYDARAYFAYGWLTVLWLAIKAIDKWVPNPKIIGSRRRGDQKGLQSGQS